MQLIKQSTVTTIYVGPVLDSAGAAVTTAVLADFQLIKNGTSAILTGATVTHDVNGNYTIALTAGNADTLGRLTLAANNSAHAMSTHRYTVMTPSTFDALVTNAATAAGGLQDVQRINGQSLTAAAGITFPAAIASPTNITAASGITLAGVTHTGAVIPTVSVLSGHTAQSGDSFARLGANGAGLTSLATASAVAAIATSITNLTNLSALCNIFGSSVIELPEDGTNVYRYTLVVKDNEDKLINLDASPTITLVNAAGTSRASLLSSVTNPSTGNYVWTITVATASNKEGLTLTASGAIGAESRQAIMGISLVDYDTASQINTLLTRIPGTISTASQDATIAADIYTYFIDGTRANAFKATGFAIAGDAMTLTSGERTSIAGAVDSTLTTAHGSGTWTTGGGLIAADIYTYFIDGTRANAFKATGFAVAGDAMTLTSGERNTLAGVVDSRLLDAGDATDLIASFVTRLGNTNVDQTAFVAAVKAALFDTGSAANKLSVDASGRVTAIGTLDATALRAAIGLGTANLDTQLSASSATDWTSGERAQIRYRLGVDGTATAPTTNQPQITVTLRTTTVIDINTPVVFTGLAFTVTQRDDFENDADIGAIGAIRVETELPLLRPSNPPRLRFGATQKLGSRYSDTVHAIGTAYAVAVANEPTQYDIFIEVPKAELNKPEGLYGWDVEAVFADGDVRTVLKGIMTLERSMGDNEARDPLNP